MPFVHTTTLISLLEERLKSLPLAQGSDQKLFERIGIFGSNQLSKALEATFAAEQRVAFIVPIGDGHNTQRERSLLFSQRTTRFTLLIADRVMSSDKADAIVGGAANVGILEMKDRVIDDLMQNPFAGQVDVAFGPGEGEPLMIEGVKPGAGNLGRECWAQVLTAYAGSARAAIP